MQAASDIFLGFLQVTGIDEVVRDSFGRAIADFSAAYADQNERDYEALVKAVKRGRLKAETGL